ncbi:MAG: ribonuclease H family protein [Leptospiraceae bacterium]|nr:ribonuclease H family protein [Leptospiraceae bacterium]
MAKKKYYVIWKGRQTGVFADWSVVQAAVHQFPGARFKSFESRAAAAAAFQHGAPAKSKASSAGSKTASGVRQKKTAAAIPAAPAVQTELFATAVGQQAARAEIYCDGGCEPNPGQSASGMAVYVDGGLQELWYGLYDPAGTNNSAELHALHQALLRAERGLETENWPPVTIWCDSSYAIQCVKVWAKSWQRNGWTKKGGPIRNLASIQICYGLYQELQDRLELRHIKAHVGIEGNELADRMTICGIAEQKRDFVRYAKDQDINAVLQIKRPS